jgi:uncharacterized protein (TIRG00374 family)
VNKRIFGSVIKYGLGLGLLAWIIAANWSPRYEVQPEYLTTLQVPIGGLPADVPWWAVHFSDRDDWSRPKAIHPGLSGALSQPIHLGPLLMTALLCTASVLLTFVRWFILVRAQELPFTLSNALRLGLIGYYFNTLLPGSVGGDIIKGACIARQQSRRTVAIATVLLDRAVGLCGLIWLCALLGGLFWVSGAMQRLTSTPVALAALETILAGAWLLLGGSIVFWVLLGVLSLDRAERLARRLVRIPKVGTSIAEFWRAVWLYRCRGRSVALALLLAMMGHVGFILTFYFASRTLNAVEQIPSLGTHFLLVPVGMAIQSGFPAPGGVGGGEYGYGMLYQVLGYAFAFGVLGSLVKRLVEWVLGLIGYIVYLRMRPELRPDREKVDAGWVVPAKTTS